MFQENPSFRLVETDCRANMVPQEERKVVNERILVPLNKNSDSTSRNEGFVKKKECVFTTPKNCFHRQECVYKKRVESGFQQ